MFRVACGCDFQHWIDEVVLHWKKTLFWIHKFSYPPSEFNCESRAFLKHDKMKCPSTNSSVLAPPCLPHLAWAGTILEHRLVLRPLPYSTPCLFKQGITVWIHPSKKGHKNISRSKFHSSVLILTCQVPVTESTIIWLPKMAPRKKLYVSCRQVWNILLNEIKTMNLI